MTEAEWAECQDPIAILDLSKGTCSNRKLRLFCIACCRQNLDEFDDSRERRAIRVAEQLADGLATEDDRKTAEALLLDIEDEADDTECQLFVHSSILLPKLVVADAASCARVQAFQAIFGEAGFEGLAEELGAEQAMFVRDVFGNPFRPVVFDPRWRTEDTVGLARGIYEDRAFDRLPLLADALMDAGCNHEDILGHCRSEGPHVRGCWVVDLVLGRD